jgi:hypothetical protein
MGVLMAVAFPIISFGVALLLLGLAKLGKAKISNAGAVCLTVGLINAWFASYLYTVGLPHLVGLMAAKTAGVTPSLGDALAPAVLKLSTIVVLFAVLFILIGLTALGKLDVELPTTGIFAIIVGLIEIAFGAVIFPVIAALGIAIALYGFACVFLGAAAKTGSGGAAAASFAVVVAIVEIVMGLCFHFGYIT